MRKVYLIIALILFTVNLFSQDVEPIPFDFTYRFEGQEDTINYVNQPLDPADFEQEGFKALWMWTNHFKLSRATKSDVFLDSSGCC